MRVLLANKFYYRRGGDCIYTMNLERMLKQHGHEVAVFAMQYPLNETSEWSTYWPSEMTKLKSLTRPFGDAEVRSKFTKLLDDFHPDVVHLNNIHSQLSPIIGELAHKRGIRVVWTLHDTKMVCPCYTCMHEGKWCEACFTQKRSVVKQRCMKNSLIGSVIGYYELLKWNSKRLQDNTDCFIAPSSFMRDTLLKGGFLKDKFRVIPNFIDVEKVTNPSFQKSDYYIFLGRVTEIKGIRTLCKAAAQLPFKLKVIGDGDLLESYKSMSSQTPHIEFLGSKDWTEIRPLIEGARFMVVPSEWSENNPLSIIESLSLGTPVLGASIGGIPELISDDSLGMTFKSGDENDLRHKIQDMWNHVFDYSTIARRSVRQYSSSSFYDSLMKCYY